MLCGIRIASRSAGMASRNQARTCSAVRGSSAAASSATSATGQPAEASRCATGCHTSGGNNGLGSRTERDPWHSDGSSGDGSAAPAEPALAPAALGWAGGELRDGDDGRRRGAGVPDQRPAGRPDAAVPAGHPERRRRSSASCRPGARVGLRVSYSRPGYGGSTPRPGRSVADVVADIVACWTRSGSSVRDARLVRRRPARAGLRRAAARPLQRRGRWPASPHPAAGMDWSSGMADENVAEFGAAVTVRGAHAFVERSPPSSATSRAPESRTSMAGLVPGRPSGLEAELADALAESFRGPSPTGRGLARRRSRLRRPGDSTSTRSRCRSASGRAAGPDGAVRAWPVAGGQGAEAQAHLFATEGHLSMVKPAAGAAGRTAGVSLRSRYSAPSYESG